ncbi:protein NLRC5-like [Dysidea avara]|uniref:protein NLRC5-like n=1 Tax=Dysidea avara TaxID=196820 RepID=UPI00331C4311
MCIDDTSKCFLVLDKGQFLTIQTSEDISEFKANKTEDKTFMFVGKKLLMFKPVCQQLTEALASCEEEINSLEFINCAMSNSILTELGHIISSSKRYWKSINLSECNIGDDGCCALCPEGGMHYDVTVLQLNLSCNHLTSLSLKAIGQMILYWKTEQLIITGNDINQYKVRQAFTSLVQQDIFETYSLKLQVLTSTSGMIVHNSNGFLSTPLQKHTFKLYAVSNQILEHGREIMQSSKAILPIRNDSSAASKVSLLDIVQTHSIHTITNVIVEKNGLQSNTNDELECCIHVVQELHFCTPLRHLRFAYCDISDQEAGQISNSITSGGSLESVEFINNTIDEQSVIRILSSLQHSLMLRYISISSIVVSNKTAKLLASVIYCNTSLEHLCLSHCELKEQGMLAIIGSLRMIESLRHCDLSDNYITNECAKQLSLVITNNCLLSCLKLSNCKSQTLGLHHIVNALKKTTSLHFLDLSNNILDTASSIQLSKVLKANTELSHVDLSKCMVTEKGLLEIVQSLSKLPSLQFINLSFNTITDQVVKCLSCACRNITHMVLSNCKMQKESIKNICYALQHVSSLQHLDISGNEFTDETRNLFAVLGINSCVNHVNFASCTSTAEHSWPIINAVKNYSSIEHLDISGNTFDNKTIKDIGPGILRCNLLRCFKISNCSFQDIGMEYIFNCSQFSESSITLLDISFNSISYKVASWLASGIISNQVLKHLYLQHCDISEQGFLAIANSLKSCDCLKSLDFSNNKIPYCVAIVISEMIVVNRNLNYLVIASCGLSEQSAVVIADGLEKVSSLTHLDISHNTVDDNSAYKIASALISNTLLNYLDLSNCNLTEKGFIEISESLGSTSNLKHLDLAENTMSTDIAEDLASSLSKNLGLNYLNLCNCKLQEQEFGWVLGTLCERNVLHCLNVSCNAISDQTASKICDVIASSASITALEISSCDLSEKGMEIISKSVLRNNKVPLQCLDISFNTISSSVAATLANIFQQLNILRI